MVKTSPSRAGGEGSIAGSGSPKIYTEEVIKHATRKPKGFLMDQFKARSCGDSPPTIPSLDPGRERPSILLVANSR